MTLKKQVCSLDLAKKLKELGVKQDAYFEWSVPLPEKAKDEDMRDTLNRCETTLGPKKGGKWGPNFQPLSAFTVAELGEMLPNIVQTEDGVKWWLQCEKYNGASSALPSKVGPAWRVYYDRTGKYLHDECEPTEADARAKMLVYLIENKFLKAEPN